MSNEIFILGAKDPEMIRIEEILKEHGCSFQYATVDGKPCHPGNAYKADPINVPEGMQVVLIECQPENADDFDFIRIDHHREGDPGYGRPASEYWQASSLGQLYALWGIEEIPHEDLILAAMDHSPAAAIRGECPGVTAEEVYERKVEELHKWLKAPHDLIRVRVLESDSLIRSMPFETIGDQQVYDLRQFKYGASSDLNLRASVLAALKGGYAVLYRQEYDGKKEVGVQGHARPETITAFKQTWGPANGLTGIYGVEDRGYAGGYLQ